MSRDDFSIPGYDEWKTRAPEDERGYWDDKEPPDQGDEQVERRENPMTLAEAYAAISAVAQPNQAIFISTQCRWHDRGENEPRQLTVEFQVSLVPGFGTICDQWVSVVSLQTAVDRCLARTAESAAPPAMLSAAEDLVVEANATAETLQLTDDDIPF